MADKSGKKDKKSAVGPTADVGTARPIPPKVGDRVTFPDISRLAWEHPADRAAMSALRRIPGFDMLIRKFVGFIGERSLRYLYLANAVRVTENQFVRVNTIYEECLTIMGHRKTRPELFVAQTPIVNAGAVGMDKPFIVLNSGTLALLSDEELRFVIGHELGHILSDHALYKTMLAVLLNMSLGRLGIPLAPIALWGIIAALREWSRKAEHSADRAGLLCVQDPQVAFTVQMKMAGGNQTDQMSVEEFTKQADDYLAAGDALDSVVKFLNILWRTHPFAVIRLAELKKWVDAGGYQVILNGEYRRRDYDHESSLYEEVSEGAKSYKEAYDDSKDPLVKFAHDVGDFGGRVASNLKDLFTRSNRGDG